MSDHCGEKTNCCRDHDYANKCEDTFIALGSIVIIVVGCKETLLWAGEGVAKYPELQTSAHFCRKLFVVNHKPQAEN